MSIKMPTTNDNKRHGELHDAYNLWLSNPNSEWSQQTFINLVLETVTNLNQNPPFEYCDQVQRTAYKKLVAMCNNCIENNFSLNIDVAAVITHQFIMRNWWQNLIESGDEMILASMLLVASCLGEDRPAHISAIKIASLWTKKEFPHTTSGDNVSKMASMLFGDAWALLYRDDIVKSFDKVGRVILNSSPVLVFKEKLAVASKADLPRNF